MFYLHSSNTRKLNSSHLHSSTLKKIEFSTSSFFYVGWNKSSSLSSSLNWHLQIFLKTRWEPHNCTFGSKMAIVTSVSTLNIHKCQKNVLKTMIKENLHPKISYGIADYAKRVKIVPNFAQDANCCLRFQTFHLRCQGVRYIYSRSHL